MAEPGGERRLAAIVAIDVAGYSRLMEADEKGTLAALKGHRAATDPIGQKHGGRIVGTAGDGVLLEFPSVVAAVECAVETQATMAERNADIADDQKMLYRIGINLGDVLVDGDDIYGDGVNVAARLEGLAEPGGVCVSGTVRDHVAGKIDTDFADMGEVEVKNITKPVHAFRVLREGEHAPVPTRQAPRKFQLVAAVAALVVLIAGGGLWWWQAQRPDFEPADSAKMAFSLPEKPSIAVLPFDNMSGDPEQDYLGDGLTENIIAVLSTSPDLFIIARNSSFTYKGKATKVQEVAEQLGVRFVLEGSVQRAGDRLRVTAQLVDAIDGRHLWAERYDRELTDLKELFAIQDDITRRILVAMHVNLNMGDAARFAWKGIGDLATYRLYMRALSFFSTVTPEGNLETERLIREALKRQPESGLLTSFIGWVHWQKVPLGISKDPKKDMELAREFAEKSLVIYEENPNAYSLLGVLDMFSRNHDSAIAHVDRAIELAPTDGFIVSLAGWVKSWSGQPQQGLGLLKRSMRLEPYYPAWVPDLLANTHLMLGQYDQAKPIYKGLVASSADNARAHLIALSSLAVIAVFEGDIDSARQYIEQRFAIQSDVSISSARRWFSAVKDQAYVERHLDALRQAGLPE